MSDATIRATDTEFDAAGAKHPVAPTDALYDALPRRRVPTYVDRHTGTACDE